VLARPCRQSPGDDLAELRSVAAMLDVRAGAAEPGREVRPRGSRGSRAWIIVAAVVVLAALAALWRLF